MRRAIAWLCGGAGLAMTATPAVALTQEEVLQSINQHVGSTVDLSKYVPYLVLALAALLLVVWYTRRTQPRLVTKPLHHRGKLLREIARKLHLDAAQIKMLKILAQEQRVSSPLTLLLCPSLLGKAIHTRNPRVDRVVLSEVVHRLRGFDLDSPAAPSSP
ncbi:MAG: hypothetical protein ABR964_01340 [Tepidisphaeraceae bacterium]|jgi:hypothetical protein